MTLTRQQNKNLSHMKVDAMFPKWAIEFTEDQAENLIDETTYVLAQTLTKKEANLVAELVTATAKLRHCRMVQAHTEMMQA